MKKLVVPGWIKTYFTFFLVNWLLFGVLRLVFLGVFHAALPAHPWGELWTTFYIGAKFDFRLAAFLCAPLGTGEGPVRLIKGWRRCTGC